MLDCHWTRVALISGVLLTGWASAQYVRNQPGAAWWDAGQQGIFPAATNYDNPSGKTGIVNELGAVDTKNHPFFEPLGSNGRACITCHQPSDAMSVSVRTLRDRWEVTKGSDPVFAAIDGSNCPNLPQAERSSHSLLLDRGLFRISLPWPPRKFDGLAVKPEFRIEVVNDPTGCNTSSEYGLKSPQPAISVFRRPRMAANLKYVPSALQMFNIKTGLPTAVDRETRKPAGMNIMADARTPTLQSQAIDAVFTHEQARLHPSPEQIDKIVEFETHIYSAQSYDDRAGILAREGGPEALGAASLAQHKPGVPGDNAGNPVFLFFDQWKNGRGDAQSEQRASIARGADVFFQRSFRIRDAAQVNLAGGGNAIQSTCATCHNAQTAGLDVAPGWMDVGTTNLPWAGDSHELPLFKVTCDATADPHPFLGRVIYTQDPGRALITGKCKDVGSIVIEQFRGLAARAPYFSNGSAASLRELVDFYDRRFEIKLTEQEKHDLVNFLAVL